MLFGPKFTILHSGIAREHLWRHIVIYNETPTFLKPSKLLHIMSMRVGGKYFSGMWIAGYPVSQLEMTMNRILASLIFGVGMLGAGGASALVIDGNLADWGVQHNNNAADWTVSSSFAASTVEDQNSSYLNPGYGGQAYDAEAMYVTWSASTLYIGFATGHSPNTPQNPGGNSYGPGDIAIDIGSNSTWDYGIELQGNAGLTQGRVYAAPTFAPGVFGGASNPTSLISGTAVGSLGSATFTTVGQTGYGQFTGASQLHYFYEIAVPLSAFGANLGLGSQFTVHWTMNCANDVIRVSTTRNVTSKVPEPGTLALLPLGLIGIAALRRRARS